MAVSTNAFKTGASKVNREELADTVDYVQRSDTPVYSALKKGKCTSVNPEWPIQDFDAPGQNIQSEGRDYAFASTDPAERAGNRTQIMEKTGKFTNTQEEVGNAANVDKINEAKMRKGLALRTDIEYSLVANNASVDGDERVSGSLTTWAETNVTRGATGANGGYNSGTKLTVAATDGTQRELTKGLIDELLQSSYSSGAKLKDMFLSPYLKVVFASFMSDAAVAQQRHAATSSNNKIIGDAEVYLGPLGMVKVHPNFVQGADAGIARNALVLDTTRISWKWLRRIAEDKNLAKTGDYKQFVLQGEGTLCVTNEKAVGVIADLFGMSATS